jgi:hypothetical protein
MCVEVECKSACEIERRAVQKSQRAFELQQNGSVVSTKYIYIYSVVVTVTLKAIPSTLEVVEHLFEMYSFTTSK